MNTIFYNSAMIVDIVENCCYYMIAAENNAALSGKERWFEYG